MAGSASFYASLEVTVDGVLYPVPGRSPNSPITWTSNGGRPPLILPFTIPARTAAAPYPEAVEIFNITQAPEFTFLGVYVDGTDSIHMAEICDATVSATDLTAAGTAEHANVVHVEWNAPYQSGCPDRLVNTSLTTACGLDSDNVATILTNAGTTTGRLFALQAVTLTTARDVTGYVVAVS
jgi:hypothetical protein